MAFEMTHIVACNSNGIIGLNGGIPWKCPEDLKHFKEATIGHVVIMGRRTFDSIGAPLKDRDNIVITSRLDELPEGVIRASCPAEAYQIAYSTSGKKPFIIGGEQIYRETINHVVNIQLSIIKNEKFSMRGNVSLYPLTALKRFNIENTKVVSPKCTVYYLRRKGTR